MNIPNTLIRLQYMAHVWEMPKHTVFEYGMYLVLWSVIVLMIHGEMASDMKSFMAVLQSVNAATIPHLYQVSSITPMNLADDDGPNCMNEVSSNPISLKTVNTMISHTISTITAILLSSNTLSMTFSMPGYPCIRNLPPPKI